MAHPCLHRPWQPAQVDANGAADGHAPAAVHDPQTLRLIEVISGRTPIQLYLEFLFSHNHADLALLKNAKSSVEARNSVCHSAVIFANAIMHAGTTVDAFLRENLDWLSRATNWAKFGATAGLGVIHRGHLSQVGVHCQILPGVTFICHADCRPANMVSYWFSIC